MQGDADARADHELAPGDPDRLLECEEQPLRDADGMGFVRSVEQQRELVAAEPGQGVARAARLREALGNGLEQLVARVVAEAVVDLLEAVEVDEQDGERAVRAA